MSKMVNPTYDQTRPLIPIIEHTALTQGGTKLSPNKNKLRAIIGAEVDQAMDHLQSARKLATQSNSRYSIKDLDDVYFELADSLLKWRDALIETAKIRQERQPPTGKETVRDKLFISRSQMTYKRLRQKRDRENKRLRAAQSRQHFSDDGANHLLESIAQTLNVRPAPTGMKPSEWIRIAPTEVIYLDHTKIVKGQNGTNSSNPVAAINGRLRAIAEYAPETGVIGVAQQTVKRSRSGATGPSDAGTYVYLYRSRTSLR